jgi:hypothetical protein
MKYDGGYTSCQEGPGEPQTFCQKGRRVCPPEPNAFQWTQVRSFAEAKAKGIEGYKRKVAEMRVIYIIGKSGDQPGEVRDASLELGRKVPSYHIRENGFMVKS